MVISLAGFESIFFFSVYLSFLLLQNSQELWEALSSYDSHLENFAQFLIGFVEIQPLIMYGHVSQIILNEAKSFG